MCALDPGYWSLQGGRCQMCMALARWQRGCCCQMSVAVYALEPGCWCRRPFLCYLGSMLWHNVFPRSLTLKSYMSPCGGKKSLPWDKILLGHSTSKVLSTASCRVSWKARPKIPLHNHMMVSLPPSPLPLSLSLSLSFSSLSLSISLLHMSRFQAKRLWKRPRFDMWMVSWDTVAG